MQKAASSTHNWKNCICSYLQHILSSYFVIQQKGLMLTSHVITQNIKETCTQGLKFNINNFYCFIKDINKWIWLFLKNCLDVTVKNKMTFGSTALICAMVSAVLPTIPFVPFADAAGPGTTHCEARSYTAFRDTSEAKWEELWNIHSWFNQNSWLYSDFICNI